MSSSTIMEYMSRPSGSFTDIFKAAGRVEGHTGPGDRGQQKVVCTPEVSLYQYNGGPPLAPPCPPLDDQDIGLDVPPNGFQCGVCGKSFQQKNTFQNHLRSHREGDDPYQCDICGKTFAVPARLTRHYRTHTGEKPYQCEYCNKSFSVKENLSVHRRIHTKERPYKCEVCERAFEHSGKLHRHMRIHTGERPHSCQICHKTFIQSGQLVIHMRTHTGEKPYVCKVCNKGFTCSKQLKVHTRTHTGEKPYSCDICGKSFGYNHVLKLHQVAHYGEKVYKCTLCNTTFNSKKALETHIKTHSSDSHPSPSLPQDLPQRSVEAPRTSPSSVSHARQHSDKENRESSDSEVSSLNSPTAESPRSPPSPVYILPTSPPTIHHFKTNTHGGSGYSASSGGSMTSTNSNGTSLLPNIPYPMLPPGVQVHQAPQSRTTYLYVTSKLPQPPTLSNQGTITVSGSGGPGSETSTRNINFKGFGQTSSRATAPETSSTRDTNFHQTASVRDKVLASLEKFGYGINASSGGSDSNSSSGSSTDLSIRTKGIQITPVTNLSTAYYKFGRTKHDLTMGRAMDGREREFSKVTPQFPENLSTYSTISKQFSKTEYHYNPYSRSTQQKVRDRSRSPDNNRSYNYGSGGVLALALTCGSKAVVSQFSSSVSVTPVIPNTKRNSGSYTTPPYSNPDSPELCIDFSRRPGSYSPKDGQQSPTPSTTPRSTPGLSGESTEELSDDYHQERHNSMDSGKRSTSSYGPRKRSSLIMEKYAQETHPSPPSSPNSKESILSQRLRLSSVIQYAEKCT